MKKIIKNSLVCGLAVLCGCSASVETLSDTDREYIDAIQNWEDPAVLSSVPSMRWKSQKDYKIIFSSKKLVSFAITTRSYTGGAHGMTNIRVGTVKNGKVLKLGDLPSDIRIRWQEAVARHFKAESFEAYLKSSPLFMPYLTENFYLDDKGIHFIYDPYEMDCYAAGTVDIFVPYSF